MEEGAAPTERPGFQVVLDADALSYMQPPKAPLQLFEIVFVNRD
jgi:hypothetical protein